MTQTATNKDRLVSDLKAIIADGEEILKSTADVAGEKVSHLRTKIEGRLKDAKTKLADIEVVLLDKTKACAHATDDFVHDQPWKAVGIAALVGVACGVLISRR